MSCKCEQSRHAPCRYMIATHAEVERRVADELEALGLLATPANPHPRQLEYDDVSKLVYLNNCIKASRPWLASLCKRIAHNPQVACKMPSCGPSTELGTDFFQRNPS